MTLSEEVKEKIREEFKQWEDVQYNGKTKKERQKLGQFYTPPELTIKMIEKFDNLEGNILDPTIGSGNLIAACIIAGANPKTCYGIELDKDILDNVCKKRLIPMGVPEKNLRYGNALNDECYKFEKDGYEFIDDGSKTGQVVWKNNDGSEKFVFGKF